LFDETTVVVQGTSWYHPLPSGAGHLPVPAVLINPATVSLVEVKGKVDDDASTDLEFGFRAGVRCALDAAIVQSQDRGLGFLRAAYKYATCVSPSETLESLYRKDPASGEPPPSDFHKFLPRPCGYSYALK
jgi:hypothetical protein